mgnify:CR=1 FL=1
MADDKTTYYKWPLPSAENLLSEDVGRIKDSLSGIDTELHAEAQARIAAISAEAEARAAAVEAEEDARTKALTAEKEARQRLTKTTEGALRRLRLLAYAGLLP